MLPPQRLTRRDALRLGALSAAALSLRRPAFAAPAPAADAPHSSASAAPASVSAPAPAETTRGVRLGVASISLRNLSVAAAAKVLAQLAIPHVSIFRTHANFEQGTPDGCRAAAAGFRAAGIEPSATSVVYLKNDEAAMRRAFENVRAAGLALMVCSPSPDAFPLAVRFARDYDIRLAVHNHGPEDKTYPSPYEALQLVEPLDPRIGLCLDVGHALRAGVDPVAAIRRCAARLYDVHLKDSLAATGAADIPVEVGRGRVPVAAILATLRELRYAGVVAFEYEKEAGDPAVGLAESVGFVRGTLAAT